MVELKPCPCGGGAYASCCGRLIEQGIAAADPESLMRSRYTAYVLSREAYLLDTWHPSTRPASLDLDAGPPTKWLGLRILHSGQDEADPRLALVEFVARYKIAGRAHRLHERSRFVCEDGCWYYVDGAML